MTIIKCNSDDCLHCHEGVCTRDEVEMKMIEASPFMKILNVCNSHEDKTDFVEFMEKRGLG